MNYRIDYKNSRKLIQSLSTRQPSYPAKYFFTIAVGAALRRQHKYLHADQHVASSEHRVTFKSKMLLCQELASNFLRLIMSLSGSGPQL